MPNTMPSWLASPYHMPTTAFVTKLRFLVDDPKFDEAIAWTEDGQSIVIRNVDLFVDKVLCSTFKTSNFSSFVRQLNMYGFNKVNGYTKLVNGRRPPMIFRNNFFVRSQPELMINMKRMPLKNKERRGSTDGKEEGKEEEEKKAAVALEGDAQERRSTSRSPHVLGSYGEVPTQGEEGNMRHKREGGEGSCCKDCGCHRQGRSSSSQKRPASTESRSPTSVKYIKTSPPSLRIEPSSAAELNTWQSEKEVTYPTYSYVQTSTYEPVYEHCYDALQEYSHRYSHGNGGYGGEEDYDRSMWKTVQDTRGQVHSMWRPF